jgi:O-antigen/teichoic acid export membrane protein
VDEGERAGPDRGEIRRAAFSAVRWTGASRVGAELVSLAAMVAMARLLTPADFGLAAVPALLVVVAVQTGQQGIAAPLVQRPEIDEADVRSAAALALAAGAALAIAVWFGAPPLGELLFDDEVGRLLGLTAPAFLLAGAGAAAQARLERRLHFAPVALAGLVRTAGGALVGVALAIGGVDAEALVLGPVAGVAFATLLLLAADRPPAPRWDWPRARSILGFGLPALGGGLAGLGAQNIDYAVLAARLPATSVGLYWRAYTLGVDYQSKLSGVLVQVGLPLYARVAQIEDKRLLRARIVRLQTLILFPLLAGLILLAPWVVPLVFGSQWEEAVVPTQILTVAGMMAAIQAGTGPLLLALGRPGVLLRWNLSKIVVLGAVVWVVAPEGLTALAIAVAGYGVLRGLVGQQLMLRRYAGIEPGAIWRDCLPAIVGAALMLAAGFGLLGALDAAGAADWLTALVVAAVPPLVYLGALSRFFPGALAELVAARLVFRRRPVAQGAS